MNMTYDSWRSSLSMAIDAISRAEDGCGRADWADGPNRYTLDQLIRAAGLVADALQAARERYGEATR
jgi:hypothetical protein